MPSRDVAVVAFAQSDHVRQVESRNEVEMVMPVLHQVKQDVGLDQSGIDFTCSGSTDYLAGSTRINTGTENTSALRNAARLN